MADYFKQKAKDPYGLKEKLIEQLEKTINGDTVVGPAPMFTPNAEKVNQPEEPLDNSGVNLLINALQGSKSTSGQIGSQLNNVS